MSHAPQSFSRYQKFVIALLAFLQFTIILDFMILSPLGAFLMPSLNINPAQFGLGFRPMRSARAPRAFWRPALPTASTERDS